MRIEAGEVAVLTEGTSGIGFALATILAGRGVHADVSVDADVDALGPDETIERFGRVDLVCNNVGVAGQQAPMWEQRLQIGVG